MRSDLRNEKLAPLSWCRPNKWNRWNNWVWLKRDFCWKRGKQPARRYFWRKWKQSSHGLGCKPGSSCFIRRKATATRRCPWVRCCGFISCSNGSATRTRQWKKHSTIYRCCVSLPDSMPSKTWCRTKAPYFASGTAGAARSGRGDLLRQVSANLIGWQRILNGKERAKLRHNFN